MKASRAFTMVELLTVVAVIALLVSILLPTLFHAVLEGRKGACKGNLKGAVTGLVQYTSEYTGMLPSRGFGPGTTRFDLIGWDLDSDKTVADSNSRNLFLAVRLSHIPAAILNCPSTRDGAALTSGPGGTRYDFDVGNGGSYQNKLSYSYHLQFRDRNNFVPGYPLTLTSDPRMAVLADRTPLVSYPGGTQGSGCYGTQVSPPSGQQLSDVNSPNHDGQGQNVGLLDGHVEWADKPTVGPREDNIYTVWNVHDRVRGVFTLGSMPKAETDCLLVP